MENEKKRVIEIFEVDRGSRFTQLFKSVGEKSQQVEAEVQYLTQFGLVDFPFSPAALLVLYESNSIFYACVNQIAKDVAGNGWSLQKIDQKSADDDSEYRIATDFFKEVCENGTIRNLVVDLIVDWGTLGNYYIEVVRNQAGKPSRLYRIPAQTIRVNKEKTTYCQTRNDKHVWFKRFGVEGDISSKDGKPIINRNKADTIANEVIHYRAPYPRSDFYGAPNIISAIGDIVGLIGSRDFNLAFFDNFGIPSAIITLTGEWDDSAEQKIRNFLKTEIKGSENAHKSLVLSQTEDCKVEIKPLDAGQARDMNFDKYEKTRKENILIAYSMPPERVGMRVVGQLGGNVAEESTKIYIQGVIEPLQKDLETIFNLLLKGLGITKYRMKFNALDIRNMSVIAERHVKQIEHGIITPNDALNELGLPPYEGGDQHYIMANLIPIVEAGNNTTGIDEPIKNLLKKFDVDQKDEPTT